MPQFIPPTGNFGLDAFYGRRAELERMREEQLDREMRQSLGQQQVDVSRSQLSESQRAAQAREFYEGIRIEQERQRDIAAQRHQEALERLQGVNLVGNSAARAATPTDTNIINLGGGMQIVPTTPDERAIALGKSEAAQARARTQAQLDYDIAKIPERKKALSDLGIRLAKDEEDAWVLTGDMPKNQSFEQFVTGRAARPVDDPLHMPLPEAYQMIQRLRSLSTFYSPTAQRTAIDIDGSALADGLIRTANERYGRMPTTASEITERNRIALQLLDAVPQGSLRPGDPRGEAAARTAARQKLEAANQTDPRDPMAFIKKLLDENSPQTTPPPPPPKR